MSGNQTAPTSPQPSEAPLVNMAPVERLIFFSDAAVAIALTLLILPLMDAVGEAGRASQTTLGYLKDNADSLLSFALSFVIIARLWRSHHRLFAGVERETPGLFWLNMAWVASIVFLPVATAMIGSLPPDPVQFVIYIGTMLAASLCLTALTWLLLRHPETSDGATPPRRDGVQTGLTTAALLVAALVIALLVPNAGYWSLLVLFAQRPASLLVRRTWPVRVA